MGEGVGAGLGAWLAVGEFVVGWGIVVRCPAGGDASVV